MSGNSLLAGLAPTHPGEILREDVLPATGLTKTEIARRLGVSRLPLHDLVAERQPVTPAMALRLAKLFGNAPEFWLNLQRDHDLRILEGRMAEELAAIPAFDAARREPPRTSHFLVPPVSTRPENALEHRLSPGPLRGRRAKPTTCATS